ncbi:glutamyl-tRNA reductase [Striga asiatica]|uniref:Glutamyl-tRNA reductase n=1 Tax=Striga asiatica TaxID=4170 RepID=A0A5A7R028_STRAF|nr:glutamyl-tRNA reductase [Striga asiatica]
MAKRYDREIGETRRGARRRMGEWETDRAASRQCERETRRAANRIHSADTFRWQGVKRAVVYRTPPSIGCRPISDAPRLRKSPHADEPSLSQLYHVLEQKAPKQWDSLNDKGEGLVSNGAVVSTETLPDLLKSDEVVVNEIDEGDVHIKIVPKKITPLVIFDLQELLSVCILMCIRRRLNDHIVGIFFGQNTDYIDFVAEHLFASI